MSTRKTTTDLTPDLETAEKAVAAVKNPRLREIAFGRILDHLLSSKNPDPVKSTRAETRKTTPEKRDAKASSSGVTAWLRELVDEGLFSEPRSMKEILQELSDCSHHLRGTDLTRQLQNLCHDKILRRRRQAPAGGGREVFHWSNW